MRLSKNERETLQFCFDNPGITPAELVEKQGRNIRARGRVRYTMDSLVYKSMLNREGDGYVATEAGQARIEKSRAKS